MASKTTTATKNTAKKTAAPETNGEVHTPRARKAPGTRAPQLRILAFLAKAKGPQTRGAIAKGAEVDPAMSDTLGSVKPNGRDWGYPSLMDAKLVRLVQVDVHGDGTKTENAYEITAAGRKVLAANR